MMKMHSTLVAAATLFALVAVAQAAATKPGMKWHSAECPSACTKILDPICAVLWDEQQQGQATEGDAEKVQEYKYFHNDCLMRYERCHLGKSWRPTHMSNCLQQADPLVSEECMRPCPFIYDPVCATNGEVNEVFGNDCVFEVENCMAYEKWIITDERSCGF